jgi:hypothetical protein
VTEQAIAEMRWWEEHDRHERLKASITDPTLLRIAALHHPTAEMDYVAIPPRTNIVCGHCWLDSYEGTHEMWPCETAKILHLRIDATD